MGKEQCAYCGQERKLEPEHVIPRSLFANANQAKIKIPSCRECNVEKSAGEDDLRDYMALSKRGSEHPEVQRILPTIIKSMKKDLSPIGRATREAEVQPYYTKSGVYLGHELLADLGSLSLMKRSLRYIIRGLHYLEIGEVFPATQPHDVLVIPHEWFDTTLQRYSQMPHPEPRILGNNVFFWVPYIPVDVTGKAGWLMCFYEGVAVIGVTGGMLGKRTIKDHRILKSNTGSRERRLARIQERGLVDGTHEDFLGFLSEIFDQRQW